MPGIPTVRLYSCRGKVFFLVCLMFAWCCPQNQLQEKSIHSVCMCKDEICTLNQAVTGPRVLPMQHWKCEQLPRRRTSQLYCGQTSLIATRIAPLLEETWEIRSEREDVSGVFLLQVRFMGLNIWLVGLVLFCLVPFFWVLVGLIQGINTPCNIFSDLLLFCLVSSPKISVYISSVKTLINLAPKNLW